MRKISIALITLNEENNIAECLESVRWADEIVIVDAHSTDKTVKIARAYTDKIFPQPFVEFSSQKKAALEKCSCEWVLALDADERVRPETAEEIQKLLSGDEIADGYYIGRRSYFLGKWIKYCGWYPGYQLRLFRKSATVVSDNRVHEGFLVNGRIEKLEGDLDHYSHPSLYSSIKKMDHYTTLEALDRIDRKKVHWYHFVFNPLSVFLLKYVRQMGFMDGLHGFILSFISSFLKMVLYMKIWLLQHQKGSNSGATV